MNSDALKQEIRKHALAFARRRNLSVDDTHSSALIFCRLDDSFHPESLENIYNTSDWNSRTQKAHQNVTGTLEMQSSNSSDALLMSIFCHPSIAKWVGVRKVLSNDMATIAFGVPGVVKIGNGQTDTTEIDMALPGVFCEAKLTEADFTHKRREVVEGYNGLQETFHSDALPRVGSDYDNYQIIRNLLAAKQHNRDHILFCDERRPDLVRRYMTTVACLRSIEDRIRCRVIFWQELVAACGESLRRWIEEKYGICQQSPPPYSSPAAVSESGEA
jgi:hypothetical protein